MTGHEHTQAPSLVLLLTREGMGHGDVELQRMLLHTYLSLLEENNLFPDAICFYTEGVKLVVEDSPVLALLQRMESQGVYLLVCQTCLRYFGLTDHVQVGIVGGMTDIITAQWKADKVVTL